MQIEQLQKMIKNHGLTDLAKRIQKSVKTTVSLQKEPWSPHFSDTTSKFGGAPAVPLSFKWPSFNDAPLAFLCQINCEELGAVYEDSPLPSQGMLLFFYDSTQSTSGLSPDEHVSWRVFYFEDVSVLEKSEFSPDDAIFPEYAINFEEDLSLPSWGDTAYDKLGFTTAEEEKYEVLHDRVYLASEPHRVFGYPDIIQDDMKLECELVTNGYDCGDPDNYEDAPIETMRDDAEDWRLLLQIDSDEDLDFEWGDMGRLYFWIKKDALTKRDFKSSWLFMQSS